MQQLFLLVKRVLAGSKNPMVCSYLIQFYKTAWFSCLFRHNGCSGFRILHCHCRKKKILHLPWVVCDIKNGHMAGSSVYHVFFLSIHILWVFLFIKLVNVIVIELFWKINTYDVGYISVSLKIKMTGSNSL